MYPSNIIAKLLRYFGNIPTTACLQAADCEVPQVSASHPCCVACLVCFLAVFISFGVFSFFVGGSFLIGSFIFIFFFREVKESDQAAQGCKTWSGAFQIFMGHFTETKQPRLYNLVRCKVCALILLALFWYLRFCFFLFQQSSFCSYVFSRQFDYKIKSRGDLWAEIWATCWN